MRAWPARLMLLTAVCFAPTQAWCEVEFWVSPDGDDTSPGTRERPFATLERARDAVRAARDGGARPAGGATVRLRGGVYPRAGTFALGAEDAGTAGTPVVYAAAPGERPVLCGGARPAAAWFRLVQDPAILGRIICEEARLRVLQVDLAAYGITDYGELSRRGFRKANAGEVAPLELYVNGERMALARWPNPGDDLGETLGRDVQGRRGVVGRSGIVDRGPVVAPTAPGPPRRGDPVNPRNS